MATVYVNRQPNRKSCPTNPAAAQISYVAGAWCLLEQIEEKEQQLVTSWAEGKAKLN